MNSIPNQQIQSKDEENETSCRRKVIIQVQLAHFNQMSVRSEWCSVQHLISSMIFIILSLSNLEEMLCSLSALCMPENETFFVFGHIFWVFFLLAYSKWDKILSTKAISVRSKKDILVDKEMERNLTTRSAVHWTCVMDMQIFAFKSQIGHNFYWCFCGNTFYCIFIVFRAKFWDCKNSKNKSISSRNGA